VCQREGATRKERGMVRCVGRIEMRCVGKRERKRVMSDVPERERNPRCSESGNRCPCAQVNQQERAGTRVSKMCAAV